MENSLRSCFSLCYWTTVAASSAVVSCQWNKSVNLSAVLKKKRKSVCSAVDQDDKKPRRPGRKSENKTAATLTHTHTENLLYAHMQTRTRRQHTQAPTHTPSLDCCWANSLRLSECGLTFCHTQSVHEDGAGVQSTHTQTHILSFLF